MAQVEGILSRQSAAQEIDGVFYGRGTNILFAAEILNGVRSAASSSPAFRMSIPNPPASCGT